MDAPGLRSREDQKIIKPHSANHAERHQLSHHTVVLVHQNDLRLNRLVRQVERRDDDPIPGFEEMGGAAVETDGAGRAREGIGLDAGGVVDRPDVRRSPSSRPTASNKSQLIWMLPT